MKDPKDTYLIGIKGVAMTALALYLKDAGGRVTGSDVSEIFVTDKLLKDASISFFLEFSSKHLSKKKYDLVVASGAYDSKNPEIAVAKKRHLNLKYNCDALGLISADKKVIAVSGTHGKTTTTAMLSFILDKAGLSPSYIIGSGKVPNLKTTGKKGGGDYFVMEADEYRKSPEDSTPRFMSLNPQIAIITSIEMDHPDMFATIEDVYNVFYRFSCKVPRDGFIVLCMDYPKTKKLSQTLADRRFETYGFDPLAKWKIVDIHEDLSGTNFYLINSDIKYGPFNIKLIGEHNILNATAAIISALKIEIPEKTIKKYLTQFKNPQRRLEKIAQSKDEIIIYDDYAHHPTAIALTLEALKNKYPHHKIWCIFQPHTFSRTEKLLKQFGQSFKFADKVFIMDIFASARENKGRVNANNLVYEIKKYQSSVKYVDDKEKFENYLIDSVKGPAIIITIGAGDIYKLARNLKSRLIEGKS